MDISNLIDNYLSNRLNEQECADFEQKIAADPELKAEVDIQRQIIEGVKKARVAELKAMLDKVPVGGTVIHFSPLRIAAGFIGATVLATGLYLYYNKQGTINTKEISSSLTDSIKQNEDLTKETELQTEKDTPKIEQELPSEINSKEETVQSNNIHTPKKSSENVDNSKPKIDLVDPTDDLTQTETTEVINTTKPLVRVANIDLEVISSEKKYKLHYQFSEGKLVLYGSFDKGLYEIIEVSGNNDRSLFLYYKTAYFMLDQNMKEVTPLKEITDPVLIQKLKLFRSETN